MEDVKHKSRKKDASSKRSRDRDDKVRDRDSEKKNRRHRESRHSERETNVDDKHMDKHRDRDSRHKEREKDRRSHRDTSVEEEYKEKHKDRDSRRKESEKDRSSGEEYREKQKGRDSRRKESEKDRRSSGEDREPVSGRRSNDRDTKKEGDRDKEKDRERKAEKERERREKEKEREREERENIEREKEEGENRERERAREKKEKEREREERENREKEKERDRARERREREIREKEKDKEREKRRRLDREDDVRDHERKRRKREEEYGERRSERHQDGDDDGRRIRTEEEERKTREQNLEEEQKKLDEDMEKRRRRVEEWQELKRKKEESENKILVISNQNEPKKWSFDEESDDDETSPPIKEDDDMQTDTGDAMVVGAGGDEDVDPLDAFMNAMVIPEVEKLNTSGNSLMDVDEDPDTKNDLKSGQANGVESRKGKNKAIGRIMPGEDSDSDYGDLENDEDPLQDEDDEEFMKKVKKTKVDRISLVDHSTIVYPPFRKNFYIEVKEISRMTSEEVVDYRKQMELKLHGKDIPKPIKTWVQTGLTSKVLEMIKKLGFEKPMPIQAQALPIIMSGRDCIGIAKTGSGKTLAFVLPMLRHIKDQPPVVAGDGPIGLIMAPTRELVQQIHSDIKKFAKVVGVSCVPVYGGSGIAQQISDLKRGTEIVVCTPGRMIDILCTSSGKITNLRRVTYLVMDEADRMFDMGFEPQITRIVQNIRPGRQTVLFSATFPRQVEILARQVLTKPIEIQIGGRSVVNSDITQLVEVRPEHERFLRLLELLGEWYEKGKILIFVQSQDKCDTLFRELLKHGYPCLSLHGAKDQTDRESTISDFKTNVCNLLIATSIAARGLDVKELELVINFDVPNHYEDYVHRVGRTGRAGRKGCAITFISEEDARYAPDLVKALELSQQVVPADLKALADGFMVKVNQGSEISHGSGYGGSGFKFNEEEDDMRKAAKKAQAREYGFEEDKSDSDSGDEDEGIRRVGDDLPSVLDLQMPVIASGNDGGARQMALVAAMNLKQKLAKIQADSKPEHFALEFDINDLPQNARWKLTHKETLAPISELFGVGITTKGQYCQAGKNSATGDRSLYLSIEGPTQISVKNAKAEVKRVLLEIMKQTSYFQGSSQPGKYSVL